MTKIIIKRKNKTKMRVPWNQGATLPPPPPIPPPSKPLPFPASTLLNHSLTSSLEGGSWWKWRGGGLMRVEGGGELMGFDESGRGLLGGGKGGWNGKTSMGDSLKGRERVWKMIHAPWFRFGFEGTFGSWGRREGGRRKEWRWWWQWRQRFHSSHSFYQLPFFLLQLLYSFLWKIIHSFIYPPSFIHSFIYPPSFIHSFIYPPSFIHSFIHPLIINSFIYPSFIHPSPNH